MFENSFMLALQILLMCQVIMASAQKPDTNKRTYIVHVEKSKIPSTLDGHNGWYKSVLKSVSESNDMLYIYENVAHGFSTRLTNEEAQSMKSQPGVLSVLSDAKYELHTTRTPQFLGLDHHKSARLLPKSNAVSEVIVGVLDTGVWPESKSFDDTNLGPIPSTWKGECETGTNFTSSNCNRKLIGARYFFKGYEAAHGPIIEPNELKSPRDTEGHGTHTASTSIGSIVFGVSLFGYANGTARGMATRARVAVYKVCWKRGCYTTDILAAMDKAVDDNVNILSLSIGGQTMKYFEDNIAIGAFAAMEKGIFVSCSGGNSGPITSSISNAAPWITTIGASTLDRDFPAFVVLGNGLNYSGVSIYKAKLLPSKKLPVVYAGNVSADPYGNFCVNGTLIPEKVGGRIVICDRGKNARVEKGLVVKAAGGVGMILSNMAAEGEQLIADAHLLPAIAVGKRFGDAIKRYVSSYPNPKATILFKGTKLGIHPAPIVAGFSSRGPSSTIMMLKPDVIAPGVNVLASWPGTSAPSGLEADKRRVEFNIVSGTSMSCPHVSGLAALLKAIHPKWSPAAIRSALMTTAYTSYKNGKPLLDIATGRPSTPYDHGAGHVDPVLASDPGLVYDMHVKDYYDFLCSINYTSLQIRTLTRKNFRCDPTKKYNPGDLNYPSFSVTFQVEQIGNNDGGGSGTNSAIMKHSRTLTNVGSPATYKASVKLQSEIVKVAVEPVSLEFTKLNQKKSYTVIFSTNSIPSNGVTYGRIEWSDGKRIVGSPVAINWI